MPFQEETARVLFRCRAARPFDASARSLVAALGLAALLAGCAGMRSRDSGSEPPPGKDPLAEIAELKTALAASQSRIESLETRLGTLGDRVTTVQTGVDNLLSNRKAVTAPVSVPPVEAVGSAPQARQAPADPEAGFASDEAVQTYRKAAILHEAGKYPEAILAFTAFLEKFPDHALAGNAQFMIGDCYFRQKEYRLAVSELERVLTSYDRSPRVPDTLRELAEAEDRLKMPERADRHRQLLTSLFPQSPAAATVAGTGTPRVEPDAETGHPAPAPVDAAPEAHEPTAPSVVDAPPTAPIRSEEDAEDSR